MVFHQVSHRVLPPNVAVPRLRLFRLLLVVDYFDLDLLIELNLLWREPGLVRLDLMQEALVALRLLNRLQSHLL